MPPIVLGIINILSLITTTGPEVARIFQQAREWFDMAFRGGLITVAQQAALRDWSDRREAAVLGGEIPPEWQIEPDPS